VKNRSIEITILTIKNPLCSKEIIIPYNRAIHITFIRLCYNLLKLPQANGQKMMKKFLLLIVMSLCTLSFAKMVDGLAAIVEGEPITLAEIRAVRQQMQLSKSEAMDILIQDRIQQSAMRDIVIDEKSIDAKVQMIAVQNGVTTPKMQKILKAQGISWTKYRSTIRQALKKEKFYKEKVVRNITAPSEDELKLYYRSHQEIFKIPQTVYLIEYSASTQTKMKRFLETKKTKGIKSKKLSKQTQSLNPALLTTILQTQDGSYTRPFNAGDRYISYKVLSKKGETIMPYESAHDAVANQWRQEQQSNALKEYFQKIKANAYIQILR